MNSFLSKGLHINSPLIKSFKLSNFIGANVFLKLDSTQPSGSFKIRGIGYYCRQEYEKKNGNIKLISSSGGNAGIAVAYTAHELKVPATIVVPESTSNKVVGIMTGYGAEVIKFGKEWRDANELALQHVEKDEANVFVHPFEGEEVQRGHSSIIHELNEQLDDSPDAIITVAGGGGLLAGLLMGCNDLGWKDTSIIVMETDGAETFHLAQKAGKPVRRDGGIQSKAKTLGGNPVCESCVALARDHGRVYSHVVTDEIAEECAYKIANDERILVELSCAAGVAAIYRKVPSLVKIIEEKEKENKTASIVMIICGGNGIEVEDNGLKLLLS